MTRTGAPWTWPLPEGWSTVPLFMVGHESRVRNIGLSEQNLLSLSYGRIIPKDINTNDGLLPESFETYQVVEPDDIVFRFTDLQNDQRSLRSGRVTERGIITSAYMGFTPTGINPRYFEYLMRGYDVSKVFYGMGGGLRQSLKYEDVRRMPILVPPGKEQLAIADYLDRETALIDALVVKQNTLIERLRERRARTVRDAMQGRFTGQMERLCRSEAHPWLGEFPSDWRLKPLWSMYRREKRTGFIDEPMVSVFRELGVVFKDDHNNLNVTAEDRSIYQLVEPGWFVINRMKAWQGSVGVSAIRGISSGHYLCFRPLHDGEHRFLNWLFRSPQYKDGFALHSRGVRPGQAEIDNELLRKLPVLVPPISEQRAIADYLDQKTKEIDALIAKAARHIDLAMERRSALIAAGVTGQLHVGAV